ncbi:MAG: macro domain-containing protein [Patescibacteria group bacterium]
MKEKIVIKIGDITREIADAIVNPANDELVHGGGLAAAIVKAGGDIIQRESDNISPIPLGEAAVTDAGSLKAKYVIHVASMRLGSTTTEQHLRSSVANMYRRAAELGISSMAIPSIGTGIGQFPIQQAAEIQMEAAETFLAQHPDFKTIIFVLHSESDAQAFQSAFNQRFVR